MKGIEQPYRNTSKYGQKLTLTLQNVSFFLKYHQNLLKYTCKYSLRIWVILIHQIFTKNSSESIVTYTLKISEVHRKFKVYIFNYIYKYYTYFKFSMYK